MIGPNLQSVVISIPLASMKFETLLAGFEITGLTPNIATGDLIFTVQFDSTAMSIASIKRQLSA